MTKDAVLAHYRANLPDAVLGFFETHRALSNFHLEPFVWEGLTWGSSENAYQAAKVPTGSRARFVTMTPSEAKAEGQRVPLLKAWDDYKLSVMVSILTAKFAQCPVARAVLLATGQAHLEECNWWGDRWWGTVGGDGLNNLGRSLMAIRSVALGQGDAYEA